MRLARLPLAAFALVTLAACSNDATGPGDPSQRPESGVVAPSGPNLSGTLLGSGMKASSDSLSTQSPEGTASQPQ